MNSILRTPPFPIVLAVLSVLLAVPAAAQTRTLDGLYSPTVIASLAQTGRVVRLSVGGEAGLLPSHPRAEELRSAILGEKPTILVETLFALKRPRPAEPGAAGAELALVYGILRSVGSLQGIEYWSASRNRMRVFYEESWRVDDPVAKRRLPDEPAPAPGAIPASETVYAHQKDLTFGTNLYRFDYSFRDDAILAVQTNLTKMLYGFVPVLAPGALRTRILVVRAEDAIAFYAVSGADAPGIFRGRLESSFSNRAEALFRWFEGMMKR